MIVRQILAFLAGACFAIVSASAVNDERRTNTAYPIPDHYKLVNDYDGALRISTAIEITKKLQALESLNGTQIVFLSVPFVGAEGVNAYAIKVFEKWDLGNNRQGNGVLFLASREGTAIVTGPGIAGALPDVKLGRIVREVIEPHWKREEYSEGIRVAIDEMIKAAKHEDTAPTFYDYAHPIVPTKPEHILIGVLIFFGIGYVSTVLHSRKKQKRKKT
jgi:uncharacterized membrane protein YgcG